MATRKALLPLLALLLAAPLGAVQVKQDALNNKRLFGIELPEGLQSFYGRQDRINSVSLQEYQAGPYAVTEVVIDMASSPLQLRLYHTTIPDATEMANRLPSDMPGGYSPSVPKQVQDLANRGRQHADSATPPVIKDYPLTTHAKTIEFRVGTKKELEQFYRAFVGAFTKNDSGASDESGESGENSEASTKLGGTIFLID